MSSRHPAGPTRTANRGRTEHAVRLLATLLLAAAPLARAQPPTVDVVENPRDQSCQASGSRARASCMPARTVVTVERDMSFAIALPPTKLVQCAAVIAIEYTQRDTIARVAGSLAHRDCDASSGEYVVMARVRDASGTTHTLEFPVAWQRADAQPIAIDADYEIGADVDLLAVRTRQTRCTCADPPPAAAPTPP